MNNLPKEIEKTFDQTKEISKTCIFTKKYCRYANKVNNYFDCKAPSDEAMLCNK